MWLEGIYFQLGGSLAPGKELQDSFKSSCCGEARGRGELSNCVLLSLGHHLKANGVWWELLTLLQPPLPTPRTRLFLVTAP